MKWLGLAICVMALSACDQPDKELPVTFKPNIPFCSGNRTLTGTFMKLTSDENWYLQELPCKGEFPPLAPKDVKVVTQQPSGSIETGIIVFYAHKGSPDMNTLLQNIGSKMGANAVVVNTATAQEGEEINIATVYLSKP
ncbi:hypothetical protein LRP49_01770 [Enterovibrio sp. ZSDZ35]|uniref:Uncharacterized protein n=1 Tax=Enterovibrio qingdaonensis TaxID=2899818 RepID=A0ABT5QGS0_9GAMM|nr:hypothetical protein [Enterovibrio sp. ZSDZ35]MDD1779913.1 hypothetical protein [Enterovibrio sp. ZSDZ35]